MTTERDPRARIVLSWLREDLHENAERVLLRALDEVDTTPQRRPFWSAWMFLEMNNGIRYAMAAAAVLVVALVGYQLLPSKSGFGGASPSPEATAPPLPTFGELPAGTYRMGEGPTFLITVPPGWASLAEGMGIRKHDVGLKWVAFDLFRADIEVFADACDSDGTEQPIGPTADDLIAALQAQENSEVADPVDVTVAGLPGSRLEVSIPAGLDTTQCDLGSLQIWVDSSGENYWAGLGSGDTAIAYVADTPGGRLLFAPGVGPEATASDVAERDAMIASIQILE